VRVERGDLAVDAVEVNEHLLKREVCEWILQALAGGPRAVLECPRLLAVPKDAPVSEQLLGDAVTRRGPHAAQVIAAAQQVAQRTTVTRGNATLLSSHAEGPRAATGDKSFCGSGQDDDTEL
jgi:hypothetical protein